MGQKRGEPKPVKDLRNAMFTGDSEKLQRIPGISRATHTCTGVHVPRKDHFWLPLRLCANRK